MGTEQLSLVKFDALLDLDRSAWLSKAAEEARLIAAKSSGREFGEVMEKCLYGTAAEQWLIQHRQHENDVRAYKDVIDPNGRGVEVKVTSRESYVEHVLRRANEAASEPWRHYEKRLYIFIGCPTTYKYEFHSIYDWDSTNKQFITSI